VTPCIYQATLGGPTTTLSIGQITAAQRTAVATGVRVFVTNSAGNAAVDAPFYVSVFC